MKIIYSVVASMLMATAANAVSFTSVGGAPDPGGAPGQISVVDFDNPNAVGYTWSAGLISTAVGSSGAAATPAGETSRYGYISSALAPNFATLSTPNVRSISFYWGSIDTYNELDVLGPGGAVLTTITGGMLPPAIGDQFAAMTNRRIFISADAGPSITGLNFRSTGVAFEFDSISAAVPEPQSWAMLILGFGMTGMVARRRRTIVAA